MIGWLQVPLSTPLLYIVHQQVDTCFFDLFSQNQPSMEVRQQQWILIHQELSISLLENQEISSKAPFIPFIKCMHNSLSFLSSHAILPLISKEIMIMRIIERWPVLRFLLPWLLENSVQSFLLHPWLHCGTCTNRHRDTSDRVPWWVFWEWVNSHSDGAVGSQKHFFLKERWTLKNSHYCYKDKKQSSLLPWSSVCGCQVFSDAIGLLVCTASSNQPPIASALGKGCVLHTSIGKRRDFADRDKETEWN